jgi:hypothetical protein
MRDANVFGGGGEMRELLELEKPLFLANICFGVNLHVFLELLSNSKRSCKSTTKLILGKKYDFSCYNNSLILLPKFSRPASGRRPPVYFQVMDPSPFRPCVCN